MSQPTFDRVRPRAGDEPATESMDVQGKAALYSREPVNPPLGSVLITCSGCNQASVVPYARAVQLALPSVHLLGLRRDHPSWMSCPSCGQRQWVKVRLR